MPQILRIVTKTDGGRLVATARLCRSFWCRLKGLMLQPSLPDGLALLLDEGADSRLASSIHMLAMRMPLGVVWINSAGEIVDTVRALPWRFYWPAKPARYVLEASPSVLELISIGEEVVFDEA